MSWAVNSLCALFPLCFFLTLVRSFEGADNLTPARIPCDFGLAWGIIEVVSVMYSLGLPLNREAVPVK